ncbi:zinc ribbon domain-containing protein [Phormidium sp. CLA17]|uniref:zinc ribbon domain-containing protein n=1 Tax=Leptolyngbya sp. Cla-17 TaxID=2803751 RepID=UPI001492F291|nr:zinc ribbon domain-containing protein [Leptolyngbya sp. Cla-17]MBM0741662.1 zinc ribbon domain-containing protein [Leptolyngbya sp. Cla-17]
MAYVCDLGSGQQLYLDTQGTHTTVAIASSSAGQQQQATSSLQTGAWSSPPEVYRTSGGVGVKLQTVNGTQFIQIQGSHIALSTAVPPLSTAEQLPMQQTISTQTPKASMQPMEPMKPMTMGTMQMNLKPMEMRMGNMEMRMGSGSTDSASAASAATPAPTRQFCGQCGVSVKPSDRFCTSCGHPTT